MRQHATTAALLCALAFTGYTQTATDIQCPPPRDQVKTTLPNHERPRWNAQVQDGAFLEEVEYVTPTMIYPDSGIGLPPGTVDYDDDLECEIGAYRVPTGSARFQRTGPDTGPVTDDKGDDSRSQPLMQGFEGMGPNGLTPPDCDLATGWDYTVTVTNDDFEVHDKCGNSLFTTDIETYLGTDPAYLLFDPKVIFDPWNGRWVMMWHKKLTSPQESALVLMVTSGSIPFGLPGAGAYWYNFDMLQNGGTSEAAFADYFDLGYSNGFVTTAGNMFRFAGGFTWARIGVWDKAQIYNALGAGFVRWSSLTNADGTQTNTPRAVKMQTAWSESSANIDGTFINSRWGGGDKLTHWKLTGAFVTNTLTRTDISCTAYVSPPNAVQPTGETLDTIDCRLMPAVTTTDTLGANGIELFTSLTTEYAGDSRVQLFKINPVSNVLEFETRFGATGLYYWFACPAADYSGSNFWVFSRTGNSAGNEPEIRFVDYDQGVFSGGSSLIRDGDGSYNGFRWGDYFGGQMDWADYSANFSLPGRPAKAWLYAEFGKNDSWGTYIGATSVWAQGVLASVTPSSTYVVTGPQGGPFSPSSRTYTLGVTGDVGLAYEITSLPSWLSSSVPTGQAFPGNNYVSLSVNSNANSMAPGYYTDTVIFKDCFLGGNTYYRSVSLTVQVSATATFRNDGGNTNPTGYWAAPPVLGTTWFASVNNTGMGNNFADIVGYSTPLQLYLSGIGDYLLVNVADPNGELLTMPTKAGSNLVNFSAPVPNDPALNGFTFYTQGYGFGGGSPRLHNAYDLRVGAY